jgi:2-polyprenyl-6-methoxyphenol hydroxylase-like FAD-dependent oxidoreductase
MGVVHQLPTVDVLVVGAGPTGLAAACELARRGLTVRIVDHANRPFAGSRGKGLQPRTLEILDGLGVAGRLVATGRFRLPVCFYRPDGSRSVEDLSDDAEPTPDRPWARTLLIPQWRVEEVLRAHLSSWGVSVEFDRALTGLTQRDDAVELGLSDGTVAVARYVIGADGGTSTVRRLVGVAFLGDTDESHRMLLGDVRLDGLDRDFWHIWTRPDGRTLALCPLPATDAFQLQAPIEPDDPSLATLEDFQAIVDTVLGPDVVRLHEATWLSSWRLNVRMVERYRVGRVFLAGDAAHIHSPAGGQGMNTGIQDAANIGWKLAAVLHGADPALLDTYQDERLPIAAAVLGLTTRATVHGQDAAPAEDDGEEMRQLGITYRGGPLAPALDVVGPQPGDRAPDAPCHRRDGSRVRLFDLQRGTHWTLYGFATTPPDCGPDVRGFRITPDNADAGDVVDTDGHACRAYAPRPGELVLVRPDGHIATRATDPDEIRAYLDPVLGHRAGEISRHPVALRPL